MVGTAVVLGAAAPRARFRLGRLPWVSAWVVVLLALTSLLPALSQETPYYHDKQRGWFWKEPLPLPPEPAPMPPPEPEVAVVPNQPPPEPGKPELRPYSPAWLREQLPLYRDRAIEDPSPDNIRDYFRLQQYAMNLAERFAAGAQSVVLGDPTLDENNRRPLSTYGAQVVDQVARDATEKAATRVATEAGLWYFFRSDCPYCAAENPILERLQKRIGLVVLPISLDGRAMPERHFTRFVPDRGHAQRLGVTQTPTLYLVKPGHGFALVSEGLVTDEELISRMVIAAHTAGWLSDEEFNATRPRKPIMSASSETEATPMAAKDALSLLQSLQLGGDPSSGAL